MSRGILSTIWDWMLDASERAYDGYATQIQFYRQTAQAHERAQLQTLQSKELLPEVKESVAVKA